MKFGNQQLSFAWACLGLILYTGQAQATPFLSFANADADSWNVEFWLELNRAQLDGNLVNQALIADGVETSFAASGETMGLDPSWVATYNLRVSHQRLAFGLYHTSMDYLGSGSGLAAINRGGVGGFVSAPLRSKFSIDLTVADIHYNILASETAVFGLGCGLGMVDVKVDLISDQLFRYVYDLTDPFGFVSVHMANRVGPFYYGFNLSAVAVEFEGTAEAYADYKLDLGYRVFDGPYRVDLLGGWRFQKMDATIAQVRSVIDVELELSGPFLGVGLSW